RIFLGQVTGSNTWVTFSATPWFYDQTTTYDWDEETQHTVADVNGDGISDVLRIAADYLPYSGAMATAYISTGAILNTGVNSNLFPYTIVTPPQGYESAHTFGMLDAKGGHFFMADMDNDGIPDLAGFYVAMEKEFREQSDTVHYTVTHARK